MFFTTTIMTTDFYTQNQQQFEHFIDQALQEDLGEGDHSGLACIDDTAQQSAVLIAKEDCRIAGVQLAVAIFKRYNPQINISLYHQDGDSVHATDPIFKVDGPAQALLATERLVLNCMQRMSGIATMTHQLCEMISHTECVLLDTRKTTPNFRYPEKWAVFIGGGTNHRIGLFDALMIKDNHIDYSGGLSQALQKTRNYLDKQAKELAVIVETRNQKEVEEALAFPWITRILLDNMTPKEIVACLKVIAGQIPTEASGNINPSNIVAYAETGVNFISMGAITHSALPVDLSLKAVSQ